MQPQKIEHQERKSKTGYTILKIITLCIILLFSIFIIAAFAMGVPVVALIFFVPSIPSICLFVLSSVKTKAISSHNKMADAEKEQFYAQFTTREYFNCGSLQPPGTRPFSIVNNGVVYGNRLFTFDEIENIQLMTSASVTTAGVAQMTINKKVYQLVYLFKDRERAIHAIMFAKDNFEKAHGIEKEYKYRIVAHTGTSWEVYENNLVINYMRTGGISAATANIFTGGGTGGKRIDFFDITAIQFKEPSGNTLGFIQISYPGSIEKQGGVLNAVDDENSILVSQQNLELAKEAVQYIETKRRELHNAPTTVVQQSSAADELKKYKELLDDGIITQEEFDAKKKQLLGI